MKIRLNKLLAHLGVASRRKADVLITEGKVSVNGSVVKSLGVMVDPVTDKVLVQGRDINPEKMLYVILHKPRGVVSTALDNMGRKTVLNLVPISERIYPVGRLDENSTGLILLTNDGDLTQKLLHPKFHIPKTYHVTVEGYVRPEALEKLRGGVRLKDGVTAPCEVTLLKRQDNRIKIAITLHEGRNRQIRRMCAALDLQLRDLKRVSFGPLQLADLKEGKWRYLTAVEISLLKETSQ
jgi:23S rRNA pseudouridine2605 synthase